MNTLFLLLWLATLHPCGFGRGPCCIADDGHIEDRDGDHWAWLEADRALQWCR